ncbi:D-alanyl-D-alanine carboxypeptidase family protein [Sphingomonas sp. G-3-2-10]|jgi:D-alanyl-D-alanine carboxypeptidase (penicillin-binding protein 5/6)|uniref:D-alanyl-D-alanine carboxypeptidase family protein n=1 Tax=Sphingomonas sp. G-3-2-10 TaxID=2728838 RepID=UPI00146C37FD|nr:D-alanyl-D-alanine carboxypeptidase family protein [Sphingomonas sp. G-3-2-10]NML05239.1 D-alanyl-D-alanine carboxypeptidase [Sphingomonas sp. G-3-2-10]
MKKLFAAASLVALSIAMPLQAAGPVFDTPAPIAFMVDLSSGATLFAKEADRRIPPASMAKMMTVYVAFDLIKQGKLKLDTKFTVQPETWRKWHGPQAGSTMFLETGEQISVQELLYGIVTLSGNDACVVLAEGISGTEEAFTALMNQQAKKLGLANSNFGTSNGWPDEGRTFVTARDLAKLAQATIEEHPALYKQFYSQHNYTRTLSDGKVIKQDNRDPLLGRVAGADGLKTGHTDEAGYGFTGSADQNGRRLVMVLAGLSSYNGRADESVKFMNWGFRAWTPHKVVSKGKHVGEADVQGGGSGSVGLVAPRDLAIAVPAGTTPTMQGKIVYTGPIKAPIKAGDHIADLVITTPDGNGAQTLPLVAEADVGEAGFFRRAWLGFWGIFGL